MLLAITPAIGSGNVMGVSRGTSSFTKGKKSLLDEVLGVRLSL
jgi:hypothetical protein